MKSDIRRITCALTLCALGAAGCTGAAYSSAYYDPYLYYGYYPSDVYYSSYYWTDPYYYSYLADGSGGTGGSGGVGGSGGSGAGGSVGVGGSSGTADGGTTTVRQTVGDAIRALARGEDVCPGQVTVVPKMGPAVCPGTVATAVNSDGMIRTGVTLTFNGCQLSNGGIINGMVDVTSSRTASNPACDAATTITLMHTSTITNLSFTGAGGRKLVIPNETGTTTTTYTNGQAPVAPASTIEGRLQVYGSDGVLAADQAYTGNVTITPSGDRTGYTIDGMLTLQDQRAAGTTTLTAAGLRRSTNCCQPDAGTLTINRTSGANPGMHTWGFTASCGSATFDGTSISLPACIF